jgi:hypothetical protein
MSKKIYKGKTRAEWIALRGMGGSIHSILPEADIQDAILHFEDEEKNRQFQRSLIVALVPAIAAWVAAIAAVVTAYHSGQKASTTPTALVLPTSPQLPPASAPQTFLATSNTPRQAVLSTTNQIRP